MGDKGVAVIKVLEKVNALRADTHRRSSRQSTGKVLGRRAATRQSTWSTTANQRLSGRTTLGASMRIDEEAEEDGSPDAQPGAQDKSEELGGGIHSGPIQSDASVRLTRLSDMPRQQPEGCLLGTPEGQQSQDSNMLGEKPKKRQSEADADMSANNSSLASFSATRLTASSSNEELGGRKSSVRARASELAPGSSSAARTSRLKVSFERDLELSNPLPE